MEAVTGTIETYSKKTGEGLIALDSGEWPVQLDLKSSAGVWLRKGLRVQLARIHRPQGIFALYIKVISK